MGANELIGLSVPQSFHNPNEHAWILIMPSENTPQIWTSSSHSQLICHETVVESVNAFWLLIEDNQNAFIDLVALLCAGVNN